MMRNGSWAVVRDDPRRDAVPGQEAVYAAIQAVWSAWARRRYRDVFDQVQAFSLFVGYPRSGHSLVGAMVNANRHAVISHELDVSRLFLAGRDRDVVYSRILARAGWFSLRGNRSNYEYQIPNQWQGRFESIRVIGDKGGGWVVQALQQQPNLLERIRSTVQVPLRLIHVVRNPFDNIAAISIWHRFTLDESIDYYFSLCRTISRLPPRVAGIDVITIHHEDFIRSPAPALSRLCAFLGLDADARYLADCCSIVFVEPTNSRRRVSWSVDQVKEIEKRCSRYDFLRGYEFDASAVVAVQKPAESAQQRAFFPSAASHPRNS
jgi:hypothetical protein